MSVSTITDLVSRARRIVQRSVAPAPVLSAPRAEHFLDRVGAISAAASVTGASTRNEAPIRSDSVSVAPLMQNNLGPALVEQNVAIVAMPNVAIDETRPVTVLTPLAVPDEAASGVSAGASAGVPSVRLGELLVAQGFISTAERDQALDRQAASGHLLGRILLDLGRIEASELAAALAEQNGGQRPTTRDILARLGMAENHIRAALARMREFGHPLTTIMRDWGGLSQESVAKAVAIESGLEYFAWTDIDSIPIRTLRARGIDITDFHGYAPIAFAAQGKRGRVIVLIANRSAMTAASSEFKQYDCEFMIASPGAIQVVYRKHFAQTARAFADLLAKHKRALADRVDLTKTSHYQDMVMALLRHACYAGASDLSLAPSHDVGVIRLKIDGVWDIFESIHLDLLQQLFGVMRNNMFSGVTDDKLRSGFTDCSLDLNTDKDEESALLRERYGDIVDRYVFRVEVGNSVQGVTCTVRINDKESTAADLHQVGLDQKTLERLRVYIHARAGVFLLCGPTGSGKTTTLHALLQTVDPITESIQTVERPVEYTHGLYQQYPVNVGGEDEGAQWLEMLKGILRNAPDKLLFGEIRDAGTARGCFIGANTGHLVLSTLHANGAAEAIARLTDLDVGRDKLSTLLLGILAQRLVRKLCNACKVPDDRPETASMLTPQRSKSLALIGKIQPARARLGGCPDCGGTGYRGRRMVYELLHCGKKVRELLEANAPVSQLRDHGLLMGTMQESGLRLVAEGVTSIDELATHVDLEA